MSDVIIPCMPIYILHFNLVYQFTASDLFIYSMPLTFFSATVPIVNRISVINVIYFLVKLSNLKNIKCHSSKI